MPCGCRAGQEAGGDRRALADAQGEDGQAQQTRHELPDVPARRRLERRRQPAHDLLGFVEADDRYRPIADHRVHVGLEAGAVVIGHPLLPHVVGVVAMQDAARPLLTEFAEGERLGQRFTARAQRVLAELLGYLHHLGELALGLHLAGFLEDEQRLRGSAVADEQLGELAHADGAPLGRGLVPQVDHEATAQAFAVTQAHTEALRTGLEIVGALRLLIAILVNDAITPQRLKHHLSVFPLLVQESCEPRYLLFQGFVDLSSAKGTACALNGAHRARESETDRRLRRHPLRVLRRQRQAVSAFGRYVCRLLLRGELSLRRRESLLRLRRSLELQPLLEHLFTCLT